MTGGADIDDRPPPALRFPAEPGWRVVWMQITPVEGGPVQVEIGVEPVTHWGLEAPSVSPGAPGMPARSTLGDAAPLNPLHGSTGERLPQDVRLFRIAPPSDVRSDAELVRECSAHLAAADRSRPRVVR